MEEEKVKEIEIQGEIANLDPIIAQVAAERHFMSCDFDVRPANSGRTTSYTLYDVFIIDHHNPSRYFFISFSDLKVVPFL